MGEYYIYEWYIVDTNFVFYVGKGKGNRYKNTKHRNKIFSNIVNSNNCESRIVVQNLSEEQAYSVEKDFIKKYREIGFCTANIADGGEGCKGTKLSDETKRIHSKNSKERWRNEKFRQKQIEIRRDKNGPYQSKEFKAKISKLVSGENNPNYGHKWTQEQKDSLSMKQSESGRYVGSKNPNAHPVMCVETGEIFSCVLDACKKYNTKNQTSISAVLSGRVHTAYGFHWKRI